jgi:hypothetical protein
MVKDPQNLGPYIQEQIGEMIKFNHVVIPSNSELMRFIERRLQRKII